MATPVRDLMTPDPILLATTDSAQTAAEEMQRADVGAVLVEEAGSLRGIVTDRDLVTGVIAARVDASDLTVGEVASDQVWTVAPTTRLPMRSASCESTPCGAYPWSRTALR